MVENLLQAKDVAAVLRCSESHVYQLDKRGLLPCSYEWPCQQSGKDKKLKVMKRWTQADVEAFKAKYRKGNDG
jgi:predicted DNA-binding transcriptional regulator AlpA